MAGYILSEQDRAVINRIAGDVLRSPKNTTGRAGLGEEQGGAPDLYVAKSNSVTGISAMDATTPGRGICPIYQAVETGTGDDVELIEVGGDEQMVYSLLPDEVPPDTWLIVQRAKNGKWWATHSASLASRGDATCRYIHAAHLLDDLIVTGTGDVPSTGDAVEVLTTDIMLETTYNGLVITAMLSYDGAGDAGTGVNYELLLKIDDFYEGTFATWQTVFADQKGTVFYQWYKDPLLAGTHTIALYVAADDVASAITAKLGTKLIITGTAADCGTGGVNACLEVVVGIICDPDTNETILETRTMHFRGYVDDAGCL